MFDYLQICPKLIQFGRVGLAQRISANACGPAFGNFRYFWNIDEYDAPRLTDPFWVKDQAIPQGGCCTRQIPEEFRGLA